ncbi:hypothetical protein HCN44_007674 [Aphidius gifuensis]|uniref:GDP-Man:Man(3)GlcNAc(2)-PP-Dol alpha-1,2-mannosyltransferase n=1 Tax=Aphidius gifuensis TaxID=684658 RepID=A0A834XMX5_APHGI|nr:GDP-Man:Man(3)GlcNAc(2)-PP-Dol alpha-1,2-mannosyltransferase-like [Aphidius gifuensis]KAF7988180.1 hypothetical protein HCN44_007674 [Aphidius gifuensis]
MFSIHCIMDTIIKLVSLTLILSTITIICLTIIIPIWIIYWRHVFKNRRKLNKKKNPSIGIFHPYCNAGGGGERVLWSAIEAIQKEYSKVKIIVYTGDLDAHPEKMLNKVKSTFDITLNPIEFIYLHRRKWIEADCYPRLTLLAQSIGSIYLGFEALKSYQPDIFIDTMGYAFTYPLFKYIGGCSIGSYTHYPTISTDMLRHVYRRVESHNNHRTIARNPFLSGAKILYYHLFAILYGLMGSCADIIMVNSSWTEEHINAIWKCPLKTHRVYPPCDIVRLVNLPLLSNAEKGGVIRIISVAQFRPEKNHQLMIRIMYELRSIIKDDLWKNIKLVLVGSCRNDDDKNRVKDMQDLSKYFAVDENVEFKLNLTYNELINEYQMSTIGIHTMWNEHFGISVVECMAAGLITIAHDSGGPRSDIIETQQGSQTGFLAWNAIEYANIIKHIISLSDDDKNNIINAARASVSRFSCETFEREFLRTVAPFFRPKLE